MEFFGDDDFVVETTSFNKTENVTNTTNGFGTTPAAKEKEDVQMKEASDDDSSEESVAKPVKNTKLKQEVKNVVDNISPATMIETVTLIEDLRDLFKDRPEDYNALMDIVRRMNPEGLDYWSAYQKISSIFGNVKSEQSLQLASRVLRYLKFPAIYAEGIRESSAISKMKVTLEETSIFNDGSDEEGRGADSKSTGGTERRSSRQKKKLDQDQVFVTPEVKGDIRQFTKLVKDRFTPGDYVKFIQAMDKYLNKAIPFEDAAKKFVNCLKDDSDLLQKFISFWEPPLSTRLKQYASKQSDSKRDQARSSSKRKKPTFDETTDTSTLDLDQLERVGPSYVVLPEQWRKALCSGRNALHRSVLNDKYMIVEGQEGYFKESTKNSAEEVLFRCEEDQYEFDRILEIHKTTLKKMLELQRNPEIEYDHVLEHVYLKCILNMYRSNDEVIHVLRSHDKVKMQDIVNKLEDKIAEMKGLREQWNVVWAHTHYKHGIRSLDHQGQAFYAKDFKSMRPEALLATIRQNFYLSLLRGEMPKFCLKIDLPHNLYHYFGSIKPVIDIAITKMFSSQEERKKVIRVVSIFEDRVDNPENLKTKFVLVGDARWIACMRVLSIIASRIHKVAKLLRYRGKKWLAVTPPAHTVESFVGSELFEDSDLLYQGQPAWEQLEAKYNDDFANKQTQHRENVKKRFDELASKLRKVIDPDFRQNKDRTAVHIPYDKKYDYYFEFILKSLALGQMDRVAYEENCMMLFGPQAYLLFTLDHWIVHFVRLCYEISKDEGSVKQLEKNNVAENKYMPSGHKIQYIASYEIEGASDHYNFGILDFTHKNEEFLKQFTWLNYARLHLDRTFYYSAEYPLFLERNLQVGMKEKDRLTYVFKNFNSEAKFDFNHHGFTGYLIARDFVQYRGPKRRSKFKPRKPLDQICAILHDENARREAQEAEIMRH